MANRVKIRHDFQVGDIVRYSDFRRSNLFSCMYPIGAYGIVVSINNETTRFRRKNAGITVHWQVLPKHAEPDSLEYTTEVYYESIVKEEDFDITLEKYNRDEAMMHD